MAIDDHRSKTVLIIGKCSRVTIKGLVAILVEITFLMLPPVAIANAGAGTVSSDLDLTQTTPFVAEYLGKTEPLLVFKSAFDDTGHLSGRYESQMDVTGQHNLLIFPDGEFALTWSCTVCKKPETTALGTWKRTGNVLAFTIGSKEARVNQKPLSNMAFFVIAGDSGEYDSILAKEPIQNHVPYDGFLARIGEFEDWKAELQQAKADFGVDSRPLYLRVLMFLEPASSASGFLLMLVVCGIVGLLLAPIPFRYLRWPAAIVIPLGVAYLIYWIPVWAGANPDEFGVWEFLFLIMWGTPGVIAAAVVLGIATKYLRRQRKRDKVESPS